MSSLASVILHLDTSLLTTNTLTMSLVWLSPASMTGEHDEEMALKVSVADQTVIQPDCAFRLL